MRSPRRIFRGHSARRMAWRVVLPIVAVCGFGTALIASGLPATLLHETAAPPSHLVADPSEIAVIDGETLRLDGRTVRLRGVDAPDRGDRCRGDLDCGGAATTALAGLVRGRRVECAVAGADRSGRPYAACQANGTDLSRAIVASGWARAKPDVPELADLELRARRQRWGLWADTGPL